VTPSAFLHRLRSARREAATLARRVGSGRWRYYANSSAANTFAEAALAVRALAGGVTLGDGPAVAAYEQRFAETVGAAHGFSFAAGRMAFYALLEALDVGSGDEVILPGFTCVVVPNAVLYRGATPVYVDIDERTFNIDPAKIEEKITSRTKVIVAQHTFGLVSDVDAIAEIATRHGVTVIEDGAHALGARLHGRPVGSLARAAFFSTDHTKVIGTGTGGMVTTSDHELAARLADIQACAKFLPRPHARRTLAVFAAEVILLHPVLAPIGRRVLEWWLRPGQKTPFFIDELQTSKPDDYPYPARLGNVQARIGLAQLERLPANLAHRRRHARAYDVALGVERDVTDERNAFVRYVYLGDRTAWQRRFDEIIDTGVWFTSVVHGRLTDLEAVRYTPGSCPIAEGAAKRTVNLPTHPRLRNANAIVSRIHA
jgi:perosamine synthetase